MRISFLILATVFCAASIVTAQKTTDKLQGLKDARFQVVVADSLFVTSADDCDGIILVAARVRRSAFTQQHLLRFGHRLRNRLAKDQALVVFFFADKASAKNFFATDNPDEEAEILRAVRGVYSFEVSKAKETSRLTPNGISEADLGDLGAN